MDEFFSSGRAADVVLALMVAEGVGLVAYHRMTGHGMATADVLSCLLPGAFLVLALFGALVDDGWTWITFGLIAALLSHLVDLSRRMR